MKADGRIAVKAYSNTAGGLGGAFLGLGPPQSRLQMAPVRHWRGRSAWIRAKAGFSRLFRILCPI